MTDKTYYITTAIHYPNGVPHIGHAYEMAGTDAMARFKRLDGYDVRFLTGTDEHGIKMAQTAEAQGMTPKELADKNSAQFQRLAEALNLSNDVFIRTTEERHHKASQAIWNKMLENGDIYEGKYAGWYSVRDEAYYDESELVEGEGGEKLSPQGTAVEWVEEASFFFRLSAFGDRLLKLYEDNPDFIGPASRKNEITSFVKSGLNDLSISRTTFDWGIPVPNIDGHVMYVWVDALTNYLTGVGYPDIESADFKKYWPADVHVIGKDIIRFHAVYWPAFLMSAGIELPKRVFAHGFLTNDGQKMSKSLGNVVDPFEIIDDFGVDPVRFFFLREVNFGNDGDYGREKFILRCNADLANDFGNLAQRSLSMIAKNCEGKVPVPGNLTDDDKELLKACADAIDVGRKAIDRNHVHAAVSAIWDVVGEANRYFANAEPWALKKTDPERMNTVLYVTAEAIRRLAIQAQAIVPDSAAKFLDMLAIEQDKRMFAHVGDDHMIASGTELPAPSPVFQRFDKDA
ncbi:methionine--tRNA ligase [Maritalea porphyrae]|uniref:Methionine--tRNA ligase n=1 Tax=Maritalea porphyrae TaxID=880732 RepID=A0ABQ5UUJ4_9HYPH|nr:methionine--tRNA ligase [Maritalea porphyrae]GLQ18400.1 methionine--tRNA ligase [Maritalea porphyrae]